MMEHAIHYRRPEAPWSLTEMTVPSAGVAASQVKRLIALGYSVVEIIPPLDE